MPRLLTPELADASLRLHHLLRVTPVASIFDEKVMRTPPAIFDFTHQNKGVFGLVTTGGENFQQYIDEEMKRQGALWGIGRYLERRDGVLAGTYIAKQGRLYHLGVDIAFPKDTPVCAPLSGEIYRTGYAKEWGDYGNFMATHHELDGISFYLFYGHLKKGSMKINGSVKAGEKIALLGDFEENGQWFHHTHLQVCLLPWKEGTTPDGYCSEVNLDQYRLLNPNPLLLVRDFVPSMLAAN